MRIGIFTNTYKPEINGVVRSISTFRDELERQGHAVYIFAPESPGYGSYEDTEAGIFRYPAIRLPVAENYPLAIPVSPHIDWVVPRLKLHIIHSQHPVLLGEEAVNFAKRLNLPHVFTHHTQYEEYAHYIPFNRNIVKTLTREVVRSYLVRSVRIIAPTESMRAQIATNYPGISERLRTLPSPVDLSHFQFNPQKGSEIRERYRLKNTFVFVTVSRLTPEKNVSTLLRAFAQATSGHPDTRLMLVGNGPLRHELEMLSQRLQIADRVIFVGTVPYDAVPAYLSAGDVFAFASTTETQGLVTLEAMATALPVVAVDAPGNRDVTRHGENGLLVPNTVTDLALAMQNIIKSADLRQKLGEGAQKTAREYSAPALTRKLVNIYEEAIAAYREHPIDYKRFSRETDDQRQFPPQWLTEITGTTEWFDSLAAFWKNFGT